MFDILEDGPAALGIAAIVLFAAVFFIGLAMGSATLMALPLIVALVILMGMLIWAGLS